MENLNAELFTFCSAKMHLPVLEFLYPVLLFFVLALSGQAVEGESQHSESNAHLLNALDKAQERQIIHGEDPTSIEQFPSFASREDEIKWKLNKAKKTLHKARQLETMAKKAAVHFGYFENTKQKHSVVSDILSSAEDTLLEAGDKMGFDYQKF